MTATDPAIQAADTREAPLAPDGIRRYEVVAVQVPIVFNREGDHDHNGMIFALAKNKEDLDKIRQNFAAHANSPNDLVRPLVLRARCGETVEVKFTNHIRGRCVGMHLVGDGYDVNTSDGAAVGANPSSLAGPPYEDWETTGQQPRNEHTYSWYCEHEGVFPFHDMGNLSGGEEGTNVHGLFGTLVVEPPEAEWTDPRTGERLDSTDQHGWCEGDGLYVDVHPKGLDAARARPKANPWCPPQRPMDAEASFREYAVFFHDEPEFVPPHAEPEPEPCPHQVGGGHSVSGGPPNTHSGHGGAGNHDEAELPPIMPISYRAEPMINRERRLWRMMREDTVDPARPVVNEEQHHSSWLFGDPETPILRAYVTDPVRIRLVHGGVKETHVFHLHVYQWHANAADVFKDPLTPWTPPDSQQAVLSPLLDSVSISPQTGYTIIPLYGAGTQQGAIGDAIWHCHLYPHFHEGMWGMFRTYDRLHDASDYEQNPHLYPDDEPIPQLKPLPDRLPLKLPTATEPGFPNFIAGEPGQKSPLPPWPEDHNNHFQSPMPADLDYRPITAKELAHLNADPRPGALFNWFPFPDPGSPTSNAQPARGAPEGTTCPEFSTSAPPVEEQELEMAVIMTEIVYNGHGWHDPQGHMYVLADAQTDEVGARKEPLVLRGNQNTVVRIEFENRLPRTIGQECEPGRPCSPPFPFDPPFPPCDFFPTPLAECGLHVHLVKFDPLVSDGASVGWNYISGPRAGKKMRYRWYVDEEFGTIFFHDHLFANFRQKRGLFGAMIAEPCGAKVLDPYSSEEMEIRSGLAGVVVPGDPKTYPTFEPFREFVFALADFVPLFDRHDVPLNPPNAAGHHSDQGVMAVNYRNEPIRERRGDPAYWFHSLRRSYRWGPAHHRECVDIRHGDPDTDVFESYPNDPIRIHVFQGSHEEQHSFQIHGMRWRQFLGDRTSPLRNQQTLGISEAFDFDISPLPPEGLPNGEAAPADSPYGPGDHLWKSGPSDDLWLGVWGLIRVHGQLQPELPPLPGKEAEAIPDSVLPERTITNTRGFRVVAEHRPLVYREDDLVDPFALVYRLAATRLPGSETWVPIADDAIVRPAPGFEPACEWDVSGPAPGVGSECVVAPGCVQEDPTPATAATPPPGAEDAKRAQSRYTAEPLILRCKPGEWVEVELYNDLPTDLRPEPFAPEVPLERRDRLVSRQVSLHADLLLYDVRSSDGANVGRNPLQTVPGKLKKAGCALPHKTYLWYADEALAVGPHEDVGAVALLQDMADFRNHRHHGLVGALVVEPTGATPTRPESDEEKYYGSRATVGLPYGEPFEEAVLILQDGLRLFLHGNVSFPIPDEPGDAPGEGPDPEDQGQKGFNYRSEPVGEPRWIHLPEPATPVFAVPTGKRVLLRLVVGADKPRNYSFTIHDHTWLAWQPTGLAQQRTASVSALSTGSAETLDFEAAEGGADYAYRTGVYRWALPHGLWGILRAEGTK